MFSVQMVFCHKRGLVRPISNVQLAVSPDHWSPERGTKRQVKTGAEGPQK